MTIFDHFFFTIFVYFLRASRAHPPQKNRANGADVAKHRDYFHFLLHKNTKFSTFLKTFHFCSLVKSCIFSMSKVHIFSPPKLATWRNYPFVHIFPHDLWLIRADFFDSTRSPIGANLYNLFSRPFFRSLENLCVCNF